MKIYIPRRTDDKELGGGWTFVHNLITALEGKVEFVQGFGSCDIFFIPGPTIAERDAVEEAKRMGKKIILRVDNIPRNSRNRNTSTSRLKRFAELADVVIYQSEWAREWVSPFIKKDGVVILNGTNDKIFKPSGPKVEKEGSPQYLYSRYNRDETKMWEICWYEFQRLYYRNDNAHLWMVGKFSNEQKEYNFDFFGGSENNYSYMGVIKDQETMAQIYRGADYLIYPYVLDACSNVLIEAIMCGTKVLYFGDSDNSAWEILNTDKKEFTLKAMGKKYLDIFESVM